MSRSDNYKVKYSAIKSQQDVVNWNSLTSNSYDDDSVITISDLTGTIDDGASGIGLAIWSNFKDDTLFLEKNGIAYNKKSSYTQDQKFLKSASLPLYDSSSGTASPLEAILKFNIPNKNSSRCFTFTPNGIYVPTTSSYYTVSSSTFTPDSNYFISYNGYNIALTKVSLVGGKIKLAFGHMERGAFRSVFSITVNKICLNPLICGVGGGGAGGSPTTEAGGGSGAFFATILNFSKLQNTSIVYMLKVGKGGTYPGGDGEETLLLYKNQSVQGDPQDIISAAGGGGAQSAGYGGGGGHTTLDYDNFDNYCDSLYTQGDGGNGGIRNAKGDDCSSFNFFNDNQSILHNAFSESSHLGGIADPDGGHIGGGGAASQLGDGGNGARASGDYLKQPGYGGGGGGGLHVGNDYQGQPGGDGCIVLYF